MSRMNSSPFSMKTLRRASLIILGVCLVLAVAPCADCGFDGSPDPGDLDDLALFSALGQPSTPALLLDKPQPARLMPPAASISPNPRPPIA